MRKLRAYYIWVIFLPFNSEPSVSSSTVSKNIKIKIHRTIVLCGCETWTLQLREEPRLRVFESRMLKRITGPKRDKIIGG
jgi:hypothetical protein